MESENKTYEFKLDLSCAEYTPTLNRVLQFYKHRGLVGEEKVALLQTLLAIKKSHFGIESLSGGGKSATADLLLNHRKLGENILLRPEDVYIMSVSSKTAQSYKHEQINKAKIIYVEELQKTGAGLEITEMLKNLAEGKDSVRDVRDQARRSNTELKIKKGKGIVYTLAIENAYKNDAEMKRRFTVLTTDVSKEQTKAVIERKSKERFAKKRLKTMDTAEIMNLRSHLAVCMSHDHVVFENPFAEYIVGFVPTPDQKVRSFIDHYYDVIEASALFHHKSRVVFTTHTPKKKIERLHVFVNLEDVIIAHLLYSDFFNKDVHSVPPLGLEVIKIFNNAKKYKKSNKPTLKEFTEEDNTKRWFTISEVHDILKTEYNIVLPHKITKDTLDTLYDAGYLLRKSGQSSSEFAQADKIPDFNNAINWKECMEFGVEQIRKHYPDMLDKWMESNMGDGYMFTNPFTNKKMTMDAIEGIRTRAIKDNLTHEEMLETEILDYITENKPSHQKLHEVYPISVINHMFSKDLIYYDEAGSAFPTNR